MVASSQNQWLSRNCPSPKSNSKGTALGRHMMLVRIISAIIGLTMSAASAYSAGLPVTITVTPQSLNLCPSSAEKALIVVQNNGQTPIRNVCLTFFSNGPVETMFPAITPVFDQVSAKKHISCQGIAVPLLPKGGSFSTLADVKLNSYSVTDSALYFQASYQFGEPPDVIPAIAVGTLTIHGQVMPNDETMKVEAKADFASLHEKKKGHLVLTITNGSSDYLILEKLAASSLSFANVNPLVENEALPLTISPQSIVAFQYVIEAKDKVIPGRYVGLVDVDARTSCGVPLHRVTDYTVTLGVFGQSELLTTIGVPSLLFLPGVLILTLWMLLWRFGGIRVGFLAGGKGANDFFVAVKDPEFWLLGITFSLLIFAFSAYLPGIGYQQPYQLADIAYLWGISLGVGLFLYVVMLILDRLLEKYRQQLVAAKEKKEADRILTSDDDVLTAINRMKLRGFSIQNLQRVKSQDSANSFKGFRVWSDNDGVTFWVVPPIKCKKLKEQLYEDLDPAGKTDTATLEESLTELAKESGAEIDWFGNGKLIGPKEMKPSEFLKTEDYFNFVNEE
ncbi:MAG: hypothetical protein BA863_18315 [Desulfovibrio sp. S3730MH75]|nr:MAG: hypothetical protein BA863_18315 [Desulfovibrio sp. S3730MH75]